MERHVRVKVKGLSPIMMHRYPLEPIEALEKKPVAEQAEISAYRMPAVGDEPGELFVPGVAMQRALVNGATFSTGKGRGSLQKAVAASVLVSPEYLGLGTAVYSIDSRRVVIGATKGGVIRHRPRIESWELTFEILWDDALLSEVQLRRVVDDTGSRVGLLEFRPERKGPFGRFHVVAWEVLPIPGK